MSTGTESKSKNQNTRSLFWSGWKAPQKLIPSIESVGKLPVTKSRYAARDTVEGFKSLRPRESIVTLTIPLSDQSFLEGSLYHNSNGTIRISKVLADFGIVAQQAAYKHNQQLIMVLQLELCVQGYC